jgi:type II secretory pathway component PulF
MPTYRYRGFDQTGAKVAGSVEAHNVDSAVDILRARGLLPFEITPATQALDWRSTLGLPEAGVSLTDIEYLTAELSLLLDSGIRIDRAITILQRSAKSAAAVRLMTALSNDLKQGKQLSEAVDNHPDCFDKLYVNLVALGEQSGRLPDVFRGLAEDLRFRKDLRQKIISASTYPLVVASVCVMAILFIFNFVVPNLEGLFADARELPWYTTMLLSSSSFMRQWQWLVFLCLVSAGFLIWRSRNKLAVRSLIDQLLIDTPGLRNAVSMVERIRFASGLAMMLDAGLPVDRALSLATGNIKHNTLRREVSAAVDKVKRGEMLSKALRQTAIFPDYYASLVEVGEESGALPKVFFEIARRSREAFSAWTSRLTTLLEPLLILIMGLIVGGVVVIMMLSITSVTEVGI